MFRCRNTLLTTLWHQKSHDCIDILYSEVNDRHFVYFMGMSNSEGPIGSRTAWKNKRPRPVALLIPGYNICKNCDDTNLSYSRTIFWKSLFGHLPDFLDLGFVGSYPRPLRPAGTYWGHQTVEMTQVLWYMSELDDASPVFFVSANCTFGQLIYLKNDEGFQALGDPIGPSKLAPPNEKSKYWIEPHKKSRTCVIVVFVYIVPLDRVY